ncbi:hypothetical protein [Rufibacter hautae]|uniref:Uncharacterized protein n=1 Tax=Rufibacter hautae TaxID=2595005 RepID=A0A5B6TA46_9BACT|nr:hypothetical protein [Rufibacter hautae]KAA3435949.1 hypothetical protein FOA19_23175 [Rufibacter hautae]
MFVKLPAVGSIQEMILNTDFIVSVTLDTTKSAGVLEIELVKGDRTQVLEYYFEQEGEMEQMYGRLDGLLGAVSLHAPGTGERRTAG